MKNYCINCKHFRVIYGDPTCIKNLAVVLPSMQCNDFSKEKSLGVAKINKKDWDNSKVEFFKTFPIERLDLIDNYLLLYPEDKDIIPKK